MKQQLLLDALDRLDWARITSALSECATLDSVKKKLQNLVAIEAPDKRAHQFSCQREIRMLESAQGTLALKPFQSETLLPPLRRGSLLGLDQLWQVCGLLDTCQSLVALHKSIRQSNLVVPHIQDILSKILPAPDLLGRLRLSVDEKPSLLSTASPALRSLRSRVEAARRKVEEQLGDLLKRTQIRDALQDTVWMQRDGRYVLPVRTDRKSEVSGVTRGLSGSGSTVFVEPAELSGAQSQLENEVSQMQIEEARILRELSEMCHNQFDLISNNCTLLEILDDVRARARFADRIGGVEPQFHQDRKNGPAFSFGKAVHPFFVLEGKSAVSNDLTLQKNALVISGPNAGGKTVAMKTATILTLMALSGLGVTATFGLVYEFDSVCIEMGDRQNILDDLSTFSGHLVQIQKILSVASEKTLIVLDEGFVGTDPTLGVALARATLEALADLGATTIITTHFSGLKGLAEADSRFQNASLEFEPQGLRPTYKLLSDVPGQSFAIELATRLGLPSSLLSKAREYAGEESLRVEKLLAELAEKRDEWERNLKEQESLIDLVKQERAELENFNSDIAGLRRDLEERLEEKFQKRFNVFENQLSIRERQFERAKRQELMNLAQTSSGSDSASSQLVSASGSPGSAQDSHRNADRNGPNRSKKDPTPTREHGDSKEVSLTGFQSLAKFHFPEQRGSDWNEAQLNSKLPAPLKTKDVSKMSTRDLLDEASETLDDLKSGWQGDALLLSDDLDTLSEMVQAKTGKTQKKRLLEAAKVPAASPSTPRRAFEKGDKVRAAQFRDPGIVLSKADSKGNVECQFGLVKAKIPSHLLELKSVAAASTPSTNKKISNQTFPVVKAQKLSATSSQRMDMGLDTVLPHKGNTLDVRGALVDTALDKVDEFLDKCWRQDISPLVIVHGHGTGKVKQGVREYLNTCGYKLRWRPGTSGEGADGATIVQLED